MTILTRRTGTVRVTQPALRVGVRRGLAKAYPYPYPSVPYPKPARVLKPVIITRYETLSKTFNELGYTTSRADPCVRFKDGNGSYTITDTYTDDIFGASRDDEEI